MKKILILPLLLFTAQSSFSQTLLNKHLKYPKQLQKHQQEILNLLSQQQTTAQKSTSAKERLIGYSIYDNTGALTDTVHLSYSGNRGSEFDYNQLDYDLFSNPYDGSPMFEYPGNHSNKLQILSDTAIYWSQDASFTLSLYESAFSSYDTYNDLTGYTDKYTDTVNNTDAKFVNTFNSDGNIAASYIFQWNGSSWDSLDKRYFSYNASKEIIQDSIYTTDGMAWMPLDKINYSYNASGDMTEADEYHYSSSWALTGQNINTYNANHQPLTVATIDPSYPAPIILDTFTYTSGINYPASWKEYFNFPGLALAFYITKHINSTGLVDTAYFRLWDTTAKDWTWINSEKFVLKFDSYNQPTTNTTYDYLDTSFDTAPTDITSYYYETYGTTAVKDVKSSNQNNFTVYPNPTNDKLFISQLNSTTAKNLLISIVNATGQRMLTESLPVISKTEEISVSNFTPGTYWLMIQDQSGNILHKQSIVKQ
ncbi:MAG TPA: T9SS type A sorting domain-containing protein [Flavipsychrobacter sp.]|nr:T9SS type A sorting domain-containing protein [Flavipsychrobacter sp.]